MTPAERKAYIELCAICGEPDPDKIAAPRQWPGEMEVGGELVHAECETDECERAFLDYNQSLPRYKI